MKDINCPPTEELRQLLVGSLPNDRQDECTEHMDRCTGCQAKLESLATEGTNLSRIVEHLNESQPMATSAYWPALRALEGGNQPQVATPPRTRSTAVPLHFLAPATDTAYLGRLAHFDVMRVLGRGGMGVVLEAFDSRLQRNVALKVLDPDLLDDKIAQQRFCREARAAASITHDNVVAVHQVERADNGTLPYLVMQLIAGESLEDRLSREGKLPLREVVRIGMQAAHGLAAAHAQGLIHRDIKPGNILLESPNGHVKLTDFGLARIADDAKLTSTGFVSGTPLYMAPEQAMGDVTDHRSDLFSLGAVLYEMSTGQPPFSGNSALAILRQIADTKPRSAHEINPAVPGWMSTTIDRLLAKKPEDRIQSAAQLAELFEFEWALMKATSEEFPVVCQVEQRRRTIRNRWIATAIGGSFLALGLLGGFLMSNREAAPAATSSAEPTATLTANSGTVWSVAFDPTSSTVAMGVEDGTVRLWDLATASVRSTIDAHRGLVWSTRFAPQGDLLATAGDDGRIKLWKPSETAPLKVYAHHNAVRGLAFADDGKTLYAGDRDGGLRIWSIDADEPIAEAQQAGAVYSLAISSDGETLATAGSDKIVRLWNAKTLAQKLPLEGHRGPVYGVSFHPDGTRLASTGWDKTVRIWNAGSGQLVRSWEGHDGDIWTVAYSPDGSKLATGGLDGAVKLWNAETGELVATYLGHNISIHAVAFNPDGTLLASGGRDGSVRVWKVQ